MLVGDQEMCRGGVPAPSPPTEGSRWAYDLSSTEKPAAACVGGGGGGRAGRAGAEVCVCLPRLVQTKRVANFVGRVT